MKTDEHLVKISQAIHRLEKHDEHLAKMVQAIHRLEKHGTAQRVAYEKMTPAETKTRGTPEWCKARDLFNRAEFDLWKLMEWGECLVYKGIVYTRGCNMDVSRHRPLSLDGVKVR